MEFTLGGARLFSTNETLREGRHYQNCVRQRSMKAAQILLAAYPATADIFYSKGSKGKFYTVQEAQVNTSSLKMHFLMRLVIQNYFRNIANHKVPI